MSGFSIYGKRQMVAAVYTPELFAIPDTMWVALTTSVPSQGATGSDLLEPTDPVYQRVAYGRGQDNWTFTGTGELINDKEIVFPVPDVDWGVISGWALCTESTSGQTINVGALVTPKRVTGGTNVHVTIGVGAIKVAL
jgi:hypothetical protein